jgi:hypothetical protein
LTVLRRSARSTCVIASTGGKTGCRSRGDNDLLKAVIGKDGKGKLSPMFYLIAIPLAFVSPWIASDRCVLVALLWLVPDRQIERVLVKQEKE